MLKKALFVVVALALFALPLVVRWLYHYEGGYEPGEVPRPDLAAIEVSIPEMEPFEDHVTTSEPGVVLVDRAHGNRFDASELSVLQARLAARDQDIDFVDDTQDLQAQLRLAKSLVVISPGENWNLEEIELVQKFVDKGGRLLLVTDPTRYELDWELYVLDYDTPHANDLAARFGVTFQPGHLYNTVENEGNFRNIRLTEFGSDELTQGLKEVVFYAAGTIASEEQALISAKGETQSSSSDRDADWPVAVLAAGGNVLALTDLTFMTEGYSAAYDNDQLVANIADFLSGSQRRYDLADFPLYFDVQTDLVFAGQPLLNSDLLRGSGGLQALFEEAGKDLAISEVDSGVDDTLFLGLYEDAETVEPYLEEVGVTLLVTPTEPLEEENAGSDGQASGPDPALDPANSLTSTIELTATEGMTLTPGLASEAEITATAEISAPVENRVRIESVGEMVLTGTALIVLQTDGERQVMVSLAHTEDGLQNALQRLADGNLEECVLSEAEPPAVAFLALCPTGEVEPGDAGGGWQKPEVEPEEKPSAPVTDTESITETENLTDTVEPPEPVGEPEGTILVISLDRGEGRYDSQTSAVEYAAILEARFKVEIWSTSLDGPLDSESLLDYDLIIWSFGDFEVEDALEEEEADALLMVMFGEIPFVMSGAYVGGSGLEAVQSDVQNSDTGHAVADGFDIGEVIQFVDTLSGAQYETGVIEEPGEGEGTVILVRGPGSEEAGAPAVVVQEDEFTGTRLGFIGFPLYLLPEDAQTRLVLNMVDWVLAP